MLVSQPHDALERHAHDAGGLHGLDHRVGLGQRHRHRLAHHDVLAGAGGLDRQGRDVADRCRDLHHVHIVAVDDRRVVGTGIDVERARVRLAPGRVRLGDRDQFRTRILRQGARQPVRGVPVAEAEDGHAIASMSVGHVRLQAAGYQR
jgi:hypothetical protein